MAINLVLSDTTRKTTGKLKGNPGSRIINKSWIESAKKTRKVMKDQIRKTFGDEIHITGGISNVSFGLPKRKIINQVFLKLAIEEGLDSGIIDPTQLVIEEIKALDLEINKYKLAKNLLIGNDEFAMNYISAYRSGEL